ncbi:MAG: O-antigen ligase family protein [Bacteroidetes bacterium]|nr:O-antigen ligase family protein [Bacteroidota bacterium]
MSKKVTAAASTNTGLAIFLAILFPLGYLVYIKGIYDPTNVPRFFFTSAILLGALWMLKESLVKVIPFTLITILLTGYYLWSLVSITWAHNYGEAVFQSQKHFLFVFSILLFSFFIKNNKHTPLYISRALVCLVPIILIVFLKQIADALHTEALGPYTMYKVPGLSGHKNLFSGYLFFMSVFFILGQLTDRSSWKKFYMPSFVIVFSILLILITRAAYVGGVAFLLTFFLLAFITKKRSGNLIPFQGIKSIGIAIGISVIIHFTFYTVFSGVTHASTQTNPSNYLGSASSNERLNLWYHSYHLFKEHPVIGVGAGNWKIDLPSVGLRGLYRGYSENLVFLQPHNDYIWIVCELGIIGLLLFGLPVWLIFFGGAKSLVQLNDDDKIKMLCFLSAVAGWAAISLFDFPKERTELLLFTAVFLGFSFGLAGSDNSKNYFTLTDKNFRYIASVFLFFNIIIGFNRISSELHVVAMNKYRNNQNHELVIQEAEKAKNFFVETDPLTNPFELYQAIAYEAQGKSALALDHFEKAYEINPYLYTCINNLAGAYVKREQYEKALPLFIKAHHVYPELETGIFNLSYTSTKLGLYDQSEQWLKLIRKDIKKRDLYRRKNEEQRSQKGN